MRSSTKSSRMVVRIITFFVVIGAWECVGRITSRVHFAPASETWTALIAITADGILTEAMKTSLVTLLTGLVLAAAVAVPLGFWMGVNSWIARGLEPYVNALYATPFVALTPLVMVWFGTGVFSRAVFVAIIMWPLPHGSQTVEDVLVRFADTVMPRLRGIESSSKNKQYYVGV